VLEDRLICAFHHEPAVLVARMQGETMSDAAVAGTFRLADVFRKAAATYSRRFVPFIILTVIASIPSYLVSFAMQGQVEGSNVAAFATGAALVLALFVTQSLASGAVIYGVVQELRGRRFSVADSIQIALRRFLPMLGIAICTSIAIAAGTVLLVFPGIILACSFYVAIPVCIAEQAGVFDSLSRSRFLTEGHRWEVFGTILAVAVAGAVVEGIAGAAFEQAGQIGTLIGQALEAIVDSFNGVLAGVFYYELRVAKEGVDIDQIASVFD
jgi:hypothetical protein